MVTRKKFLQQAGIIATGLMVAPSLINCRPLTGRKRKVGLQLYSLRNEITKDVKGVIGQVAKAGYNEVETYGYSLNDKFWGLTPKEFKDLLQANNLTSYSGHYNVHQFLGKDKNIDSIREYIDAATVLGQTYVVAPYINDVDRVNADDYKRIADKLNRAGELCKSANLKMAYHNHAFEFDPMGGKTGFDILLAQTDPKLVDFELDLYWVVRAGKDPLTFFNQHPGRFTMWHVKDMDKSKPELNTEIGNGTVDFKIIFNHAEASGLKQFFVEQENFSDGIDPFVSIAKSSAYVKESGFALIK
ncbi:MAG TPA: sugar phosphate isomerase/epimerase [Pedobacter sp.]|jgi:sugar phosphate isomerase/epimerase